MLFQERDLVMILLLLLSQSDGVIPVIEVCDVGRECLVSFHDGEGDDLGTWEGTTNPALFPAGHTSSPPLCLYQIHSVHRGQC